MKRSEMRNDRWYLYIDGKLREFRLRSEAVAAMRGAKRAGKKVWAANHLDARGRPIESTFRTYVPSMGVKRPFRKRGPYAKARASGFAT